MVELGGTWPGAYLLRRGLFMPWELETVLDPELARAGLRRLRWRERIAALLEDGPAASIGRVALLEASLYMRHQLLRDTDWSSMAHSLEVRVPLVDVALLRRVAPRSFAGKRLLAASPARPLPEAVLHRAKTGFTIPIERWMDRLSGPVARPEPWARRWARTVAHSMLPHDALRHRPAQAAFGARSLARVA
jgi:asparagine synthase (glutamine-hydrolysing)